MSGETIEAMLAAQGVRVAPGRGEKLAAAIEPLLGGGERRARAPDFDTDPTSYLKHFDE